MTDEGGPAEDWENEHARTLAPLARKYQGGTMSVPEPVAIGAALSAVLVALVAVGVIDLSEEAQAAVSAAVVLVVGLVVRSKVSPVA